MAAPTYTMNIIMDYSEFKFCPKCGKLVIEATVETTNGPESAIMVCPDCQVAWPVQED